MSPADDHGPELEGDDARAAEYVLGVLPLEERQEAARRIETDPAFARLVDEWQAHFSPLDAAYDAVEPPAGLKRAIDARLHGAPGGAADRGRTPPFWRRIGFWQALAAAAILAQIVQVGTDFVGRQEPAGEEERLVATLESDETEVRYVALFDAATGEVALSRVGAAAEEGRDYELWLIEGENAPVSLGVVPQGERAAIGLSTELASAAGGGDVFAISLEPDGGSPTGQPTGPVVAVGQLRAI